MRFLDYPSSNSNWSYGQLQPSNGAVCLVSIGGQRSNFMYVATVVLFSGSSRGMTHPI
jgi:hypothetical protein